MSLLFEKEQEQVEQQQKKQRQTRHLLSFEDICPQWNNALATGFSNNFHLNIAESKYCIVGEAHRFRNSAYICFKCWEYSQSFTFCVYGMRSYHYTITNHKLFEYLKENFVEHFNQCHSGKKGVRAVLKECIERCFT